MNDDYIISVNTTTHSISNAIQNIESRIEKDKNETIDWVSHLPSKFVEQEKRLMNLKKS